MRNAQAITPAKVHSQKDQSSALSRKELAEYCNRLGFYRRTVTERIVKYWERLGLISRHPAYRHPVRYTPTSVASFIQGRLEACGTERRAA